MGQSIRKQTVKGVYWSAIERFSSQGTGFVIEIIIARLLSPSDFGLIGMLAIFMAVSQVFIDGGFTSALIQKQDRTDVDFSTAFYINLMISVAVYTILFFSAPYIAIFYNQPLLSPITRVYSISLVISAFTAVNQAKLSINVDFKTKTKITLISHITAGIVAIICAYYGMAVWALVVQILVSTLLAMLLSFYYVRWFPLLQFSRESFRRLFSFGSKLLGANLISQAYSNIYNLFVGKVYSSAQLGFYTRAFLFARFPSTNLSNVLSRVAFPVLSQLQNDDERLMGVYSKYIRMSAYISFPLILGLAAVAKPTIILLLKEKWAPAIILLQLLCISVMWDCITKVNLNLLYVKGRSDLVLRLEVIKKTIGFSILIASLPFGLIWICVGKCIYGFIAYSINTFYTGKLLNYGFWDQMRDVSAPLVMSLIVVGECFAIQHFIQSNALSLLTCILVSAITYIGISKMTHNDSYIELLRILKIKK